MREYLSILMPLLHGEPVAFTGETMITNAIARHRRASTPVPVLVAALGPKMLKLAGHGRRRHRHLDDRTGHARRAHRADDHDGRRRGRAARAAGRASAADLRHRRRRRGARAAAKIFEMYGFLP